MVGGVRDIFDETDEFEHGGYSAESTVCFANMPIIPPADGRRTRPHRPLRSHRCSPLVPPSFDFFGVLDSRFVRQWRVFCPCIYWGFCVLQK